MRDIPLEVAVLCWHPSGDGEPTFAVRVLGDPYNDRGPHTMTGGAVYSEWQEGDTNKRLRKLFGEVMSIMASDGIPFEMIHVALLKIPEYRREVLAADVEGAERVPN